MRTFKKILCALDLSQQSTTVAEYAVSLAKTYGAEIFVVYVQPPLTQYAAFEMQPKVLETFAGEVSDAAGKNLRKIMSEAFAGVPAKEALLSGYPAEEILKAAKSNGADLIIMGTHGRKGVDLIVFGSVAEKVVKNASIPVLTVRP